MSSQNLLALAEQIRLETVEEANSALRVGGLLKAMVEQNILNEEVIDVLKRETLKTYNYPYLSDINTFLNNIALADGLYNYGHGFAIVIEFRDAETNARTGIYQFKFDSAGMKWRQVTIAAEGEVQEFPAWERSGDMSRYIYDADYDGIVDKAKADKDGNQIDMFYQRKITGECRFDYMGDISPVDPSYGQIWYENETKDYFNVCVFVQGYPTWFTVPLDTNLIYKFEYKSWLWTGASLVLIAEGTGGGGTGNGDMLKSTYDTNNNGNVDKADRAIADKNGLDIADKYQQVITYVLNLSFMQNTTPVGAEDSNYWYNQTTHVLKSYVVPHEGEPYWNDESQLLRKDLGFKFNGRLYLWNGTTMVLLVDNDPTKVDKEAGKTLYNDSMAQAALAGELAGKETAGAAASMATQLIDGATDNTLKKLQDKITGLQAIVGGTAPDGDSVINTVTELLAVFSTFPEGSDMVTLLSAKLNVTDLYNAFDCIIEGKAADARTVKVLNDALSALTTVVAGKVTAEAGKELYPTADKTKLANIAEYAQVNVIEDIKVNGVSQPVDGKSVSLTIRSVYAAEQIAKPANGTTLTLKNATETTVNNTFTNSNSFTVALPEPVAGYVNESILILTLGASAPTITHPAGVVWRGRVPVLTTGLNKEWVFIYEQIYINNAWAIRAKAIQTV